MKNQSNRIKLLSVSLLCLLCLIGCQKPGERVAREAVRCDYIRITFTVRDSIDGMKILLASKEDKEMFSGFIGTEIEPQVDCDVAGKVEFMLNGKPNQTYALRLQEGCTFLSLNEETIEINSRGVKFLGTRYDTYQKINFSTLAPTDSILIRNPETP